MLKKEEVALWISLVVTLVWATTVLAEMFIPTFSVSAGVHAIMGAIAAYFFKEQIPLVRGKL